MFNYAKGRQQFSIKSRQTLGLAALTLSLSACSYLSPAAPGAAESAPEQQSSSAEIAQSAKLEQTLEVEQTPEVEQTLELEQTTGGDAVLDGAEPAGEQTGEPDRWQYDVSQLLADADAALAADRLLTPIEDNAFDRYHAVLLLKPGNEAAQTGLRQIFQRYVSMSRQALSRGEFGKARALIERARSVDSESLVLAELVDRLAELQRQRLRANPQLVIEPGQKEIELNPTGLARRDNTMVEQLQSLAMQVKETEETLLIVARSDSEGRWIYQKMADGVPGYRLRGDIRLGRIPRVLLLPPID